jgi:hypothetical protein
MIGKLTGVIDSFGEDYLGELYLQIGRTADARRQLAKLDRLCPYGCAQREELARWIVASN